MFGWPPLADAIKGGHKNVQGMLCGEYGGGEGASIINSLVSRTASPAHTPTVCCFLRCNGWNLTAPHFACGFSPAIAGVGHVVERVHVAYRGYGRWQRSLKWSAPRQRCESVPRWSSGTSGGKSSFSRRSWGRATRSRCAPRLSPPLSPSASTLTVTSLLVNHHHHHHYARILLCVYLEAIDCRLLGRGLGIVLSARLARRHGWHADTADAPGPAAGVGL